MSDDKYCASRGEVDIGSFARASFTGDLTIQPVEDNWFRLRLSNGMDSISIDIDVAQAQQIMAKVIATDTVPA